MCPAGDNDNKCHIVGRLRQVQEIVVKIWFWLSEVVYSGLVLQDSSHGGWAFAVRPSVTRSMMSLRVWFRHAFVAVVKV